MPFERPLFKTKAHTPKTHIQSNLVDNVDNSIDNALETIASTSIDKSQEMLDVVVCGGGIAGCCVVWQAIRRGLSVGLIDHLRTDSASRVAAGLVTPITGTRLALSWRWPEFFPAAQSLYAWIEDQSTMGHALSPFWEVRDAYRIFASREEAERFESRWMSPTGQQEQRDAGLSLRPLPTAAFGSLRAPWGGMSMSPAARLATESFLAATISVLQPLGRYWPMELDCDRDVQAHDHEVLLPAIHARCRRLFLCQGFGARANQWFCELPLHPARGDILEIETDLAVPQSVVHADAWFVPLANRRGLLGATYDRQTLSSETDSEPGRRAHRELLDRWNRMCEETPSANLTDSSSTSTRLLRHRAAIRPASYDRHPLIGRHAHSKNIYCLNGLGSKGSLMAPALANQLLDHALNDHAIDPACDWKRRKT
ncbi:MAG: FAD-binding oxidoreductase [Planctomycetota bacterium]